MNAMLDPEETRAGHALPVLDLLMMTWPMQRFLRGEKKEYFRRTWVMTALNKGAAVLGRDEGRLPANPREAVFALHEAVLELGLSLGASRTEFAQRFNAHGEAGHQAVPEGVGAATERCAALLAILCARRMENKI